MVRSGETREINKRGTKRHKGEIKRERRGKQERRKKYGKDNSSKLKRIEIKICVTISTIGHQLVKLTLRYFAYLMKLKRFVNQFRPS